LLPAVSAGLMVLLACTAGCRQAEKSKAGTAEERLGLAWQALRLTEYRTAVSQFEAVAEVAVPGSETHLQAIYGQGCTWWLRQEGAKPDKARALFEQVIALAAESEMAGWSRLALARMLHLVPVGTEVDYPAVRAAYQQVIDASPDHPAAAEAFLYQQATHLIDGGEEGARTALGNLRERLSEDPDDPFAGALLRLSSECCKALGDVDGELAELLIAHRVGVTAPDALDADHSNTYWQIATIAEFKAGRLDVARKYYRRLLDEYPTDMRGFSAEKALERIAGVERRLTAGNDMPGETE